jgi:hypothetical protein
MAIVVIYIVLGILYESFTQPLVILSGLPAAGFGALLLLIAVKSELSLYAFVGVVMLVGLVKKNGIMMVDFAAVAERDHGKTPTEAILEACLVRFRPIMMTSMCALAGTLPIALGWGAGAESRRPLGLAVVGGLAVSQLLTLYITPVYYVYIEGARVRMMRRRAATLPASQPVHAPAEATLGLQRPIEGEPSSRIPPATDLQTIDDGDAVGFAASETARFAFRRGVDLACKVTVDPEAFPHAVDGARLDRIVERHLRFDLRGQRCFRQRPFHVCGSVRGFFA